LSDLGRHDEALFELRRARELDPEALLPRAMEGSFLHLARRYDAALAHLDSVVELAPHFVQGRVIRAIALASVGRYDATIRECDTAIELEAGIPRSTLVGPRVFPTALRGYALARSGRRAEAEEVLPHIRERERDGYVPPHDIAMVLHALERDDEALQELRRAVDVRDVRVTRLGVHPHWDRLRGSPSFQALLSRVNLLDVSNRVLALRPGK
jgi:tetratricopeptide (TPR) repeat protein